MARVVLVTGGSRSGKSGYAQHLAESLPGCHAYVATCPVVDEEMRQRIDRHQRDREGKGWMTIEEPLGLAGIMSNHDGVEVVLVDCLTLWISNLMYERECAGEPFPEEDDVASLCADLLATCRQRTGTVIMVTNEVGMSVVPENAMARRYRDLVGRANQTIAAEADDVVLVTCGIPMVLKGKQGA